MKNWDWRAPLEAPLFSLEEAALFLLLRSVMLKNGMYVRGKKK